MKPITVKDPIWSQFHRLMRSHHLNESDMLEKLMKERKSMEKNIDPESEIEQTRKEEVNRQLTTKLDRIEHSIPELEKHLRESILTSRNHLIDELKRLEDLADRLRIEISKPLHQESILSPEIIEKLTKLKEYWSQDTLNETVKTLIDYYKSDKNFLTI